MVIIDSLEEPGLLFPRHRGYVFVKAANLELEEEVSQLCYAEPEEEKDVLRFQWGRLALMEATREEKKNALIGDIVRRGGGVPPFCIFWRYFLTLMDTYKMAVMP